MKSPKLSLLTCICFVISINYTFAQYTISGSVLNSSGGTVEGATVRLAVANVQTTTASNGAWSMEFTPITHDNQNNPGVQPQLKGNIFQFSILAQTENVRVQVYDLQGRILASFINENLAPGSYQIKINLGNIKAKMCLLKADIGTQSYTRKLPFINTGVFGASSTPTGIPIQSEISANAENRNATLADTIVVTKSGYQEGRKAIAAYSGTHVIIISAN